MANCQRLVDVGEDRPCHNLEDGAISGGAGSAVSEWAQENQMKLQIIICGIPDEFVEHASREEMLEMTGLDKKGILAKVKTSLS